MVGKEQSSLHSNFISLLARNIWPMKCYWQGSVLVVFVECDQPRSASEQRRWTLRRTLQSPFRCQYLLIYSLTMKGWLQCLSECLSSLFKDHLLSPKPVTYALSWSFSHSSQGIGHASSSHITSYVPVIYTLLAWRSGSKGWEFSSCNGEQGELLFCLWWSHGHCYLSRQLCPPPPNELLVKCEASTLNK